MRVLFTVARISDVLRTYSRLVVYRSSTKDGTYVELTTPATRIPIVPETAQYYYYDDAHPQGGWYRAAYANADGTLIGEQGTPTQGIAGTEKVGWTFGNYKPPPKEWGEVYTADDMRYTMLFGIDSTAADIAVSEWGDEQFRQIVREAVSEFEAYLTMDIRRRVYLTRPADAAGAATFDKKTRARHWREGVDYTDEEDTYDFDPQLWTRYGFLQLRHWPVIRVTRCVWQSPVRGTILDMVDKGWVRTKKQFGQLHLYPTQGVQHGPYSVYGPLWASGTAAGYPDGFEVDYETGYESAEFLDDGLRGTIAKYATIKALAVIGDGLLAGFSSQSVSLDGLSESFSSTQSATSAYFGARIAQYSKEIDTWLARNRYKYSPPPISFVG